LLEKQFHLREEDERVYEQTKKQTKNDKAAKRYYYKLSNSLLLLLFCLPHANTTIYSYNDLKIKTQSRYVLIRLKLILSQLVLITDFLFQQYAVHVGNTSKSCMVGQQTHCGQAACSL